jgi:hypothetical protein
MTSLWVMVAASALGIEVGWQPLDEGGHEYTIQIEPQLIDRLRQGEGDIVSDVPSQLDVRRYRITVGTGKLSRVDGPARPAPAAPSITLPHTAAPQEATIPQASPHEAAPGDAGPHDSTSHDGVPHEAPPQDAAPHDGTTHGAAAHDAGANAPTHAMTTDPFSTDHVGSGDHPTAADHPDHATEDSTQHGSSVLAKREHDGAHGQADEAATAPTIPATLPVAHDAPKPIESTAFSAPEPGTGHHNATKDAPSKSEGNKSLAHASATEPARPWMPFLIAAVLLSCSLGANLYLGWIAWDARARYRSVLARFRTAPAS